MESENEADPSQATVFLGANQMQVLAHVPYVLNLVPESSVVLNT